LNRECSFRFGGADCQPAIVHDPDLRVDVDQLSALTGPGVERTREEAAGAFIRVDEHTDLSAAVVVAAGGCEGRTATIRKSSLGGRLSLSTRISTSSGDQRNWLSR